MLSSPTGKACAEWEELDEVDGVTPAAATLSRTEPACALSCIRDEERKPSLAEDGQVSASRTPEGGVRGRGLAFRVVARRSSEAKRHIW
jgi:hypothetical protein